MRETYRNDCPATDTIDARPDLRGLELLDWAIRETERIIAELSAALRVKAA